MKTIKIAVTGAAGQIGYSLLFRIASGQMFGPETKVALSLLELPAALPVLEGVAMELEDCAFPLLEKVFCSSDPRQVFADVDWALLVGSVPRKAGMERADLLKINGGIFIEQGKALDDVAKKECRILVVGNPCNTNAYIAKSVAKRIPPQNFFAMTMLDQNRASALLARRANVPITDVSRLAVWGNHSSTMYPNFYEARISGRSVLDAIGDEHWLQTDFLVRVQQRGAAIIKARGLSSAASAAHAVMDTVKALHQTTPAGQIFSVAVCSDGSYGVPAGLMFSFPVRCQGASWHIEQGQILNEFSKQKVLLTQKELEEEAAVVQTLF